jgi:hypothetical protein
MNRQSILTQFLILILLSILPVAFFGVPAKAAVSEAD